MRKKSEKKSFYFEDYTESEIFNNKKNSNILKISLNRVTFLSFIFFSLILIFGIKIIYLSLSPEKYFYSDGTKKDFVIVLPHGPRFIEYFSSLLISVKVTSFHPLGT